MQYSQFGVYVNFWSVVTAISRTWSVRVGWLLTSQMLAPVDCISRLSRSVELTLRYTTPDVHCTHRQYDCDGGKKLINDIYWLGAPDINTIKHNKLTKQIQIYQQKVSVAAVWLSK